MRACVYTCLLKRCTTISRSLMLEKSTKAAIEGTMFIAHPITLQ
jgi:hypothetical protein